MGNTRGEDTRKERKIRRKKNKPRRRRVFMIFGYSPLFPTGGGHAK
jgi:hypothetical protein